MSEQSDRPWTPGPWTLSNEAEHWQRQKDLTYNIYSAVSCSVDGDPENTLILSDAAYYPVAPEKMADAELIALAPEMAEAILDEHDGSNQCNAEGCSCILCIAEKLRAIGSDHE